MKLPNSFRHNWCRLLLPSGGFALHERAMSGGHFEFRGGAGPRFTAPDRPRVRVAFSRDGGRTFTPPIDVAVGALAEIGRAHV